MVKIVTYPNQILSKKSERVTNFDHQLRDFIASMHVSMFTANGIGLAANQIGDKRDIFVVFMPDTGKGYTFVNPKIGSTEGECEMTEGCLSFPGQAINLKRPSKVFIKAQDSYGKPFSLEADGLLARCILHEMDHLNSTTFLDRLRGEGDAYPQQYKRDNRPRQHSGKKAFQKTS